MVPAYGMLFNPGTLVLGIGRFQAAVFFLAWILAEHVLLERGLGGAGQGRAYRPQDSDGVA